MFDDANRDGRRQPAEQPIGGHQMYLFTATGAFAGSSVSDANGSYSFSNLTSGDYVVELESTKWAAIRADWVPTTTGSLRPRQAVAVQGAAVADFGWRRIVSSSDISTPISAYTGATGLVAKSYNDVVTAREIHDAVAAGELVGEEAAHITVHFALTDSSYARTNVSGVPGEYYNYRSQIFVSYLSWIEQADVILSHEYGHGWSLYYAHIVQQDASLTAYLHARGVAGDPRVGTSYAWDPREMIAEDYRQLFGSATARSAQQVNTEIPPAAAVAGLREFLRDEFRTPSGNGGTEPPAPAEPTEEPQAVPLAVSDVSVTPTPVRKNGEVTFRTTQDADIVAVISSGKQTVRTLSGASAAGEGSLAWDRLDDSGRRVKSGSYAVTVQARNAAGESVTSSPVTFQVS